MNARMSSVVLKVLFAATRPVYQSTESEVTVLTFRVRVKVRVKVRVRVRVRVRD